MRVETRHQVRDTFFRRSLVYPALVFLPVVTISYLRVYGNLQVPLPLPRALGPGFALLTLAVLVAVCQHRHDDWVASYLVAFAAPFAWFWMLSSAIGADMGRSTASEAFFGSVAVAALMAIPVFVGGYAFQTVFRQVVES